MLENISYETGSISHKRTHDRLWEDEMRTICISEISNTLSGKLEMLTLIFSDGDVSCSERYQLRDLLAKWLNEGQTYVLRCLQLAELDMRIAQV